MQGQAAGLTSHPSLSIFSRAALARNAEQTSALGCLIDRVQQTGIE